MNLASLLRNNPYKFAVQRKFIEQLTLERYDCFQGDINYYISGYCAFTITERDVKLYISIVLFKNSHPFLLKLFPDKQECLSISHEDFDRIIMDEFSDLYNTLVLLT